MPASLFEGPEKKFELVVVDGHASLRSLGDGFWRGIVRAARAEVLHELTGDAVDAYLLSESSLLVHEDYVTMITCGRTRLADALEALVTHLGADQVALLIYERKNEHFPENQATTFEQDARRLAALLPGQVHRFGDEGEHCVQVFCSSAPFTPEPTDTTLEILMHGIDPARATRFGVRPMVGTIAAAVGLEALLPGFSVDEHLFEPEGYSLNALRGDDYYTVHVTPQQVGSYASFETNAVGVGDGSLVRAVVEVFGPETFDIVSFAPGDGGFEVPGYRLREHVADELGGYRVAFRHFSRPPTGATGHP